MYCYELYHQLRIALNDTRLTLTAEPDKRGHPDFFSGKRPNPDFIFHTPGCNEDNYAVVEVECRLELKHLTKDLKTLKLMKSKGYQLLVLLLFAVCEVPWQSLKLAASEAEINLNEIVVFLHQAAGSAATHEHPLDCYIA
ncbi:MAG: hypothetical protein ACYDBT_09875 [Desulfobulbaceae bacterium]